MFKSRDKQYKKCLVIMVGFLFTIQMPYQQVLANETTKNQSLQKENTAESIKIYEDKTYGKYVKAEDFGLDKSGKKDGKEAIYAALKAANEVEGGAAVMLSGTVYIKDEQLKINHTDYPNVTGLIGSVPLRDSTRIIFDKKQVDYTAIERRIDDNRTENKQEAAILIENYDGFKVARFYLEHAYDSDYQTNPEFYRSGDSYFGRSNGIYINDSSNVTVDNVNVARFNRAGVYFGSSKAIARRIGTDGRPFRESISEKVSRGELDINDPSVPFGVNNVVRNSYLHNNRVAGVMFTYQKDFLVDDNIFSRNGHELDAGTGYGVASGAASYNLGVSFTNNYSNHNYRKGYDIHDGNHIVVKNNTSFGDRLYGIEVYNRDHPMTNVAIEDNLVVQDPNFKLDKDDDLGTPNAYMGISIQANEKQKTWSQALDRGQYSIVGNIIQNLTDNYPGQTGSMKTVGIQFRNHEKSNDYNLTITGNSISGTSAHHIIDISGQTGSKATPGAGSGDIIVSNNVASIGTVTERPIYIKEVWASTVARGSVDVNNNQLTIGKVTTINSNRNMIDVEQTNAKTVSITANNVHYTSSNPFSRDSGGYVNYLVSVGTNTKDSSINITNNAFKTDPSLNLPRNVKNGLLTWGWHKTGGTDNVHVCDNTLDGTALSGKDCPLTTTTESKEEVTTGRLVIETRESDELPIGYRKVVQEGTPKSINQTFEVKLDEKGNEVSRRLVSTKTVTEGTPRIILIGTATESVETTTVTEPIDFEVEIREDRSKPAGYQEEIQAGISGEKSLTYELYLLNNIEKSRKLLEEKEIKAPQKRIIVVGTGVERVDYETISEEVDFETEIVYDYTQPKGYEKVQQEGAKGTIEKRYKVTYLNDSEVSRELESERTVKEAQKEIIVKGTGVVVKTEIEEVVTVTEFKTVLQEDSSKPKGYREVIQKGSAGKTIKTYEIRMEDDVEVSRTLVSEVEDPKAIDEIVVVGTGEFTERTVEESELIPYKVIEVEDPNLPVGETVVDTRGVNGNLVKLYLVTYLNGQENGRKLIDQHRTEPQNEVVRVGTAPIQPDISVVTTKNTTSTTATEVTTTTKVTTPTTKATTKARKTTTKTKTPTKVRKTTSTTVAPSTTTTTEASTSTTEAPSTTTTVAPITTVVPSTTKVTTVSPAETTVPTVPTPRTTTVDRPVLPRTGTSNNPWFVVIGLGALVAAGGFFYLSRKEKI